VQNGGDASSQVLTAFGVVANNCNVGFDTSGATINTSAFRMGSGQAMAYDGASVNQMAYDGTGIRYAVSGTLKHRLNADGSIYMNGAHGVQVIPTLSTGSAAAALTGNKPGSTTAVAQWLSVVIDGTQYWMPVWGN
jgi:hypothetical protein